MILGLAGRKQSGKDSACNFIAMRKLLDSKTLPYLKSGDIADNGKMNLYFEKDDEKFISQFSLEETNYNSDLFDFVNYYMHPIVRRFSFADKLKHVCKLLFNLKNEQCWGDGKSKSEIVFANYSVRDILQNVGTKLREFYNDVWIQATLLDIAKYHEEFPNGLAIITDVRYQNEVHAIKNAGGKVMYFKRRLDDDTHPSEAELDKENFDWLLFDYVINNSTFSIHEKNEYIEHIYFNKGV